MAWASRRGRQRGVPAHEGEAGDRLASAASSPALTINRFLSEHRCLTFPITGRGVSHLTNDEKLARRAPVHGVVRQPPKVRRALRPAVCAPAPQPRGHRPTAFAPPARRLAFRYRRLPHREGGCAAGGSVKACASELRQHAFARLAGASAREVRLCTTERLMLAWRAMLGRRR